VPSLDLVPSSSDMDFLGVLLCMNDCLQEPFQGIRLSGLEEAKYTAMDDETRSHSHGHGRRDAQS